MSPLAIDLFCGLGGWAEGLMAEHFDVIGFDIERHRYPARAIPENDGRKVAAEGVDFNSTSEDSRHRSFNYANECALKDAPLTGGWTEYPAQLVIQDVLTLHGSQFRDAALIVASPPCQEFSYMAMPWTLAKEKQRYIEAHPEERVRLTALFDACFRIQREACEAAGRHVPMVVENVRGACKWVGRSRWNYGSFHLWGDVPALMPMTVTKRMKSQISCAPRRDERVASTHEEAHALHYKLPGFRFDGTGRSFQSQSVEASGVKQAAYDADAGLKMGGDWFSDPTSTCRRHGSKSSARKAASALIAKIPLALSQHIARVYRSS
jgi:hypothetical protein